MALKQRIENDLKAALLGGNRFVSDVLRGLKATILNEEVAQGKRDEGLDDATIEQLIAKEVKKRAESAALYEQGGRPELAQTEQQEAEVLRQYLPKQLSETELRSIVEAKVAELDVSGPAAMGQVIGAVKKEVGTAADGATLAKIVKETLS
ncbi:GatB/YqeY domain-containing protein [Streptomyces caniscabiei]|uniref:GatB/YqeY domain-containing protein n=1 Tax=Streptomyces caniscabiei TaxID=2746961 RepID=UPI0029AD3750|nr:GatB/YqeY domain-containing protein [Streptomyces caniscabiei]MDX2776250.1 GatB/YqeY domain-containing protein [Streptomyces caniscabiei]